MKLYALVKADHLDEAEAVAALEQHAIPRLAERNGNKAAGKELAGIIAYARNHADPDWNAR